MNRNFRYGGIIVCLATIAFCSSRMAALPLWGYLPLFLITAVLGLYLFTFIRRYRLRWLALALSGGVALTLGFPMIPLAPLTFGGFVPLLIFERELSAEHGLSKKALFKYAYAAFALWNILTTWWVANSSLPAGMLANFLNALFMCVPFLAFHHTKQKLGAAFGYFSLPVYWIAFEYLHLNWDISWPWITLGNSFADLPSWVQWYEFTGVLGGSLWILLANITLYLAFFRNPSGVVVDRRWATAAAAVVFLPLAISVVLRLTDRRQPMAFARVVAVQPNYEPHYQKFDVPEYEQLQQFLRLSAQQVDSTTDYLIFPETSFERIKHNDIFQNPTIRSLKSFVRHYPKLHLTTGIGSYRVFDRNDVPDRPSIRTFMEGSKITYWEAYNSAIQISANADDIPIYLKSKLVPGPEILPYHQLFGFLQPVFDKMGGTVEGIGIQSERSVFQNGPIAVAPVICYESIYGDFCGGYVRKGANAIFVMTNDGWWDDTPGYRQHLQMSRLRAIELHRSVARAANTGSSCFIDAKGNVLQATKYGTEAAIKGDLALYDDLTFYARFGDYIGFLASVLTGALAFGLLVRFFQTPSGPRTRPSGSEEPVEILSP